MIHQVGAKFILRSSPPIVQPSGEFVGNLTDYFAEQNLDLGRATKEKTKKNAGPQRPGIEEK
jgi:hypothetical protein